jgi:hypothetical protein
MYASIHMSHVVVPVRKKLSYIHMSYTYRHTTHAHTLTRTEVVASAEQLCPIIRAARDAARRVEAATGGLVPPYPGAQQVRQIPV